MFCKMGYKPKGQIAREEATESLENFKDESTAHLHMILGNKNPHQGFAATGVPWCLRFKTWENKAKTRTGCIYHPRSLKTTF